MVFIVESLGNSFTSADKPKLLWLQKFMKGQNAIFVVEEISDLKNAFIPQLSDFVVKLQNKVKSSNLIEFDQLIGLALLNRTI